MKTWGDITFIADFRGKKMSLCGHNNFTSFASLQADRNKELRFHVLCLAAKAKSFRETSGLVYFLTDNFLIKI